MTPKVQSIEDTGTSIDKPFTGVKYTVHVVHYFVEAVIF